MQYFVVYVLVAIVVWMAQMDVSLPPRPVNLQRRLRILFLAETGIFALLMIAALHGNESSGIPLILTVGSALCAAMLHQERTGMTAEERAEAGALAKAVLEDAKPQQRSFSSS